MAAALDLTCEGLAASVRALPDWMPKRDGITRRAHKLILRSGCNPIRQVRMRLGHRMIIDIRSGTELHSYYSGQYDDSLIKRVLRLVSPRTTVLDVGANIGFWTIAFGMACRTMDSRVVAFEPMPSNFQRLSQNVWLNDLASTVRCENFGLSDHEWAAALTLREDFMAGAQTGNAAIALTADDARFSTVSIPLRRLDDVAAELVPLPCSVIKVDIEGHEDSFLRGARGFLAQHQPAILCELNKPYYRLSGRDHAAVMAAALAGLGYRCLRQEGGRFVEVPTFDSPMEMDDILLVHESKVDSTVHRINATGP